jgi:two-component system sensor histidine kinase/response regulator
VNGQEAVEKFSPGNCDAILMDCNMPVLDGFGATAAIRKIEAEKNVARRVRIIALTANALVGERERCLAAGMDDYISKPYTMQQLYHALLASVLSGGGVVGSGPVVSAPVAENFNPARLEQLCDELDRAAVADMVGDFLTELPGRLTEIQRLYHAGNWPDLERAAHSLKGLVALFGFPNLSERFLAVENGAEAVDAARVKEALVLLDAPAKAAAQRLREWLKSIRSQSAE